MLPIPWPAEIEQEIPAGHGIGSIEPDAIPSIRGAGWDSLGPFLIGQNDFRPLGIIESGLADLIGWQIAGGELRLAGSHKRRTDQGWPRSPPNPVKFFTWTASVFGSPDLTDSAGQI